jgi:hypothetical protein
VQIGDEHLIYLMFLCPGGLSSNGSEYGQYVTTLNYGWGTGTGALAISVQWDRQADTVVVGKQEFIRENGNVFVVQSEANGAVICRQLGSLGPYATFQQVVELARKTLSHDELIKSLTLDK